MGYIRSNFSKILTYKYPGVSMSVSGLNIINWDGGTRPEEEVEIGLHMNSTTNAFKNYRDDVLLLEFKTDSKAVLEALINEYITSDAQAMYAENGYALGAWNKDGRPANDLPEFAQTYYDEFVVPEGITSLDSYIFGKQFSVSSAEDVAKIYGLTTHYVKWLRDRLVSMHYTGMNNMRGWNNYTATDPLGSYVAHGEAVLGAYSTEAANYINDYQTNILPGLITTLGLTEV